MKKRIDFCFNFLLNHPILTSNFSFRNRQFQKYIYSVRYHHLHELHILQYCSVLTLHLQWSIIFIFCVLVPHGMNVIVFGKEMGKEPEGYDLFWYCLRDTVNADKIISSAIIVYDKFTTILWQYIIFLFWMVYLSSKQ